MLHWVSLGFSYLHVTSIGFPLFLFDLLDLICFIWLHSVSLGITWFHLGSLGFTMNVLGSTLDAFGFSWLRLEASGLN